MNANQDMLGRLRSRRMGFSLPQAFYGDPGIHDLDLDHVFYREWIFAGHDCELAEAGQFLTLQIGAYPVVVVRDHDGGVRAFHNSCRHRGSRVCTAEHGRVRRFVCPYHQWSYELDGALLKARHMGEGFDKAPFGLKPVHCRSVTGYVFVCVAAAPPSWQPFADAVAPSVAPHRLAEAKVAHETTIVENGNWKLVWENNRECSHCAANHPELLRAFPETPTVSGVSGAGKDPAIVAHWARCEAAGLPSAFRIADSGQYRTARMPLIEGVESFTTSGRPAVRRPLSDDVSEPRIGSMLLFHYPSTWNHILGDHAISFRVLPLGPTQTQVTTKWLVHRDAVEGADYVVDELTHVWRATNDQDRRVVEENQRGILSPAYEPGPYSPEHEGGVAQFVDWYARTMERAQGGDAQRAAFSRVA